MVRGESGDDWVRFEIESALSRGIPVIPVLLDDAGAPPSERLRETIRSLFRRQALQLTRPRWRYEFGLVVDALRRDLASDSTTDAVAQSA